MKQPNYNLFYGVGVLVGIGILVFAFHKLNKKHNFILSDFDSPDQIGSGQNMNRNFLMMLEKVERLVGFELKFSSGFRTEKYNKAVGGVRGSAHTKGLAVDIKAPTIVQRDKIVWAAKKVGFKRIGIGATFVHLDVDDTKPQYVAWGYPIGNKPPYNPF